MNTGILKYTNSNKEQTIYIKNFSILIEYLEKDYLVFTFDIGFNFNNEESRVLSYVLCSCTTDKKYIYEFINSNNYTLNFYHPIICENDIAKLIWDEDIIEFKKELFINEFNKKLQLYEQNHLELLNRTLEPT
jgi:hypothetical protein